MSSTNSFLTQHAKLLSLCAQALEGNLVLEDFYREWPRGIENSRFASLLYEDIEDGVQHFPAHIFSGKPDYKTWKSSDMFVRLYLNHKLLLSKRSENDLIEARSKILKDKNLTSNKVDYEIYNLLG